MTMQSLQWLAIPCLIALVLIAIWFTVDTPHPRMPDHKRVDLEEKHESLLLLLGNAAARCELMAAEYPAEADDLRKRAKAYRDEQHRILESMVTK